MTVTRKYDHITPILQSHHWLPVKYRIIFKILLLVYKGLNGVAPTYIADLLSYRKYTRALRSASQSYLQITRMNTKSYGDRAFSVSGPKLWNGLPLKIRESRNINSFKAAIKLIYFERPTVCNSSLFPLIPYHYYLLIFCLNISIYNVSKLWLKIFIHENVFNSSTIQQ